MILAQLTASPPVEIAAWLGCLAFVAFLVKNVLSITDRFKERPPPAQTYMTKNDCAAAHEIVGRNFQQHVADNKVEFDAIRAEIKKDRADNQVHASARQAKLFDELKDTREKLERRINRMSIGVARICGRMNIDMPPEDAEL